MQNVSCFLVMLHNVSKFQTPIYIALIKYVWQKDSLINFPQVTDRQFNTVRIATGRRHPASKLQVVAYNGMCTQRRLRSAWASAQPDQSLRCVLNG